MAEESSIQYANEYLVVECKIFTVGGLELDLTDLLVSVNIYEDIFSNSISGDISFVDTNNILGNANLIGQEKLSLILATPDGSDNYDRENAIDFSKQPLYIYKVNASVNVTERTTAFSLSFTTAEIVRNNHIRISKSFDGDIMIGEQATDIITKIVRDKEDGLASTKELFFEKTLDMHKYVIPNMRPFDAINMLARISNSSEYNFAPTFLFYETIKGYFFRTIEGMMDRKNPRMIYRETTPNQLNDKGMPDLVSNLQNILSFNVRSSTNTLVNQRMAMYSSKLLELDFFNKKWEYKDFSYTDNFEDDTHVDKFTKEGSANAPIMSEATDDFGNKLSDYPDSVFYLQSVDKLPDNPKLTPMHEKDGANPFRQINTAEWLQRRKSRFAALDSAVTVHVEVPGNTSLQAGDLIGLEILNKSTMDTDEKYDKNLSGRYLVRKLHHVFTKGIGQYKHTVHMECVRDAMSEAYPSAGVSLFDSGNNKLELIPPGSADPGDVKF